MYLFWAVRPAVGVLVVLLVLVSFRLQGQLSHHRDQVIALVIIEFLAVSATMLWNDWYDRAHDAKRGKTHAMLAPRLYARAASILWAGTLTIAVIFFLDTPMVIVVIALQAAASFIYGPARRVPMGSCLLVAVTSASGTLFPIWFESLAQRELFWLLAISTFCLVVGRELLGDIRDAKWDQGYKQTLAVIKGVSTAFIVAAFFLLLAGGGALMIVQPGWRYLAANAIFCLGITAITSIRAVENFEDPLARAAVMKRLVDVALIIFLFDLLWSSPGAVALGFLYE